MSKNTLILLAHANVNESTMNKRIKETLENETNVRYKDLSSLYEKTSIDVKKEQEDLVWADKIIFQFPLYWYSAPGILKNWIDKVFAYGFVYEIDNNGDFQALALKNKEFQMIATMGGSKEFYENKDGLSINECLATYSYTAKMLGMKEQEKVKIFSVAPNALNNEEITKIALDVKNRVLN